MHVVLADPADSKDQELVDVLSRLGVALGPAPSSPGMWREGSSLHIDAPPSVIAEALTTRDRGPTVPDLNALRRLAEGLAHDLSNLLTVIYSNADSVYQGLPADGIEREDLGEVLLATERATAVVRQLLQFSSVQTATPRPVQLNDVIRELARDIEEEPGVVFTLTLQHGLPVSLVDPALVRDLVSHLLANAVWALDGPGSVELTTSVTSLCAVDAVRWSVEPGPYVRLTVRDSGRGMDASTVTRAFEPFFSTRPPGQGSGMGLAVCHGIVRQAGGAIGIESALRRGTRVTVLLPVAEPEHAGAEPESGRLPSRILLVEDERGVRRIAHRLLAAMGCSVVEAEDGVDALEILAHDSDFDLVLSDVVMPRMGGRELATRLAATRPELSVAFMSAYAERDVQDDDIPSTSRILRKPFRREEFSRFIARCLEVGEEDQAR